MNKCILNPIVLGLVLVALVVANLWPHTVAPAFNGGRYGLHTPAKIACGFPIRFFEQPDYTYGGGACNPFSIFSSGGAEQDRRFLVQALVLDLAFAGVVFIGARAGLERLEKKK